VSLEQHQLGIPQRIADFLKALGGFTNDSAATLRGISRYRIPLPLATAREVVKMQLQHEQCVPSSVPLHSAHAAA
jgi:hypothetical protein